MIHTSTQKVVVFRLGNEEFALSIEQVHSIEKSMEVTHIPNMPEFVNGVLHLTGNVFPIIDMRLLLKKRGFMHD